jgi:hypothetical protein
MKTSLLIMSIFALVASGFTSAAPGNSGGQRQSPPQQSHKQAQPREQERTETQVRENQDQAKGKTTRTEEQERTREARAGESDGSAKSAEMRSRQQESKEIKEEYKSATRSGEAEKVKGKKPWWKFWGPE